MTAYMQQKNHSISDILLISRQPLYEGGRTYYTEGIIRGYIGRGGSTELGRRGRRGSSFFGRRVFLSQEKKVEFPPL